ISAASSHATGDAPGSGYAAAAAPAPTNTPIGGSPVAAVSVVEFSQCANDKPPSTDAGCPGGWINGTLNSNNSHYEEDEVVPQRFVLNVSAPTTLTEHTIHFQYLARKGSSSGHAYDSLATWNYTQGSADRCQGLLPADC